jgi:sterol desaturase/sphingolipid hydroxylase (fatty acid hydroxylase superfamily)
MENSGAIFPRYGKVFSDFSTLWKKVFHTVEKSSPRHPFSPKVFHAMEE